MREMISASSILAELKPPPIRRPKTSWIGSAIFIILHLACLAVFFTEITVLTIALCAICYFIQMFGITAGYHRYFSHRAYSTSRWFQFVLALGASMTAQKGPLWWAAHHRQHHKLSDQPGDLHSVIQSGFCAPLLYLAMSARVVSIAESSCSASPG